MRPYLIKEFTRAFGRGIWGEVVDRVVEMLVFCAGIIFLLIQSGESLTKLIESRWEAFIASVWVISALVVWHGFRSAWTVAKEIRNEDVGGYSPIISASGQRITIEKKSSYFDARITLYGIATVFTLVAAIVSYAGWLKFPRPIGTTSPSTPVPRSYLTLDGPFRFPLVAAGGQLVTEINFQVGDEFQFNIFYKQEGPNPLEIVEASHLIYVEPDHEDQTQNSLITDFEKRIRNGRKLLPRRNEPLPTVTQGEHRFYTAFAPTVANTRRIVTQRDLEEMQSGEEILFVIVEIVYEDVGQIHHCRRCEWLQPPASLPSVWHMCKGFNHSD